MGVILFQQRKAMLDSDEHGFKYAQAQDASDERERNPQRGMHPQGGLVVDLDHGNKGDDQKPHNNEGEEGGTIRRVMVLEHEAAMAAGIDNAQAVFEQLSRAAFGAAGGEDLLEERSDGMLLR